MVKGESGESLERIMIVHVHRAGAIARFVAVHCDRHDESEDRYGGKPSSQRSVAVG